MANTTISVNQATDPAAPDIAVDRIAGADFQREKITWGAEGTANDTQDTDAGRLPIKNYAASVVLTQTVPVGTNTPSAGVDLIGLRNWGILIPSNFDGSTISFFTSDTLGGTYVAVRDITNTIVSLPVTLSSYTDIPGELMAIRFLKIVTGINQAGTDTVFSIIGKS